MYKIELATKAAKTYQKLPEQLRVKINTKLMTLAKNPYAKNNNVKPLVGMPACYRLRIGDWRIIYEVMDDKLKIFVIKIAQRKEIYKQ
ncbi:MAG: type II toxin-antitoxin system RelE/ParE family toxin [Gammaproteobacteria bacterium]|nr:type II toxin-antitoxin system RelE/ParE family toxin [Gammaproteobacteria bacterium]